MLPARHQSVSPRREPSAAQNRTAVGILEPTAQMTNNSTAEEAARRSALADFGAASMMPVPTMTQTFVPGELTSLQPSKQVPVPQQMPAAHRNAPMPIAMTAGALMPEALRSVLAPPPTPTPVATKV